MNGIVFSITKEQRRFESINTQLGIPIHTAYVALKLAYANPAYHGFSYPGTGPAPPESTVPL